MTDQEKAFKKMCIKQEMFPHGFQDMAPADREAAERQVDARLQKFVDEADKKEKAQDQSNTFYSLH